MHEFRVWAPHKAALELVLGERRLAMVKDACGWDPAEVPDPQDPATFARSRLDWAELDQEPHAGLLAWHRELLALRRRRPELTDDRLDRVAVSYGAAGDDDAGLYDARDEGAWLCVQRGSLSVVANLGPGERQLRTLAWERIVLTSDPDVTLADATLSLPPDTVAILEARA